MKKITSKTLEVIDLIATTPCTCGEKANYAMFHDYILHEEGNKSWMTYGKIEPACKKCANIFWSNNFPNTGLYWAGLNLPDEGADLYKHGW